MSSAKGVATTGPVMTQPTEPNLVAPVPRPPSAGVAGPGAPIKSDLALSIFQMADQDATSTLSLSEFEDLVLTVEPAFATEQISEIFQEIVCDDELCKESISFLTFMRWMTRGNAGNTSLQNKLMRQNIQNQAQLLFQEADTDGSGTIDETELKVLGDALGLKWHRNEAREVMQLLDTDGSGGIDFAEFFEWFLGQTADFSRDRTGAFASQLRLMLRAKGVEQRQVLITGFPFKATEGGVERFFARCGNITSVKMLPWAKTGKPSGRAVIQFAEMDGAQAALRMHKKRMGPRDLGVFRINVGDSEVSMPLPTEMHSAILGPKGMFLRNMEAASGARMFLRHNDTDGWVTVKGTPKEREAASALLAEATASGVAAELQALRADIKEFLLAGKGRSLRRIEHVSGAKVRVLQGRGQEQQSAFAVKKKAQSAAADVAAVLQITGVLEQRAKAKTEIAELTRSFTREVHAMPSKFHGTLKGKGATVVSRVEEETSAIVKFSNEQGGSVSISGSRAACAEAWALIQFLKGALPALLSQLRAGSVSEGDFLSKPDFVGGAQADEVWAVAVVEGVARFRARDACARTPEEDSAGRSKAETANAAAAAAS